MIPGNKEKILVLNECKTLALQNTHHRTDAMQILRLAKTKHCTENTVTTHFPNSANICKMINRARQASRARAPRMDGSNLLEFEFLLEKLDPEVPKNFYRSDVTSEYEGKTNRHFIFFNPTQKKLLRQTKLLLVDATFGVVMDPHTQLLTIHATVKRAGFITMNVPIAYVLMQGKAQSAYKAVFQKIKDMVEEDGPMEVEMFVVDYEKAIWNALRAVWVNADVRGCWFYFNQCIYKYFLTLKMGSAVFTQFPVHKMLRRLMTLPLIDKDNIPIVFAKLKERYAAQINDPTFDGVKLLFEYFEKQWIRGTGTGFVPEDYSCFGRRIRTTNIVESWNGEIFKKGRKKET